jgi:23S rRNA pseudouridine2605 synthase
MNKLPPRQNSRRTGLARALSKLGYCSRSQGAVLVRSGRVEVNGRQRRNPEYPIIAGDHISVDGQLVQKPDKLCLVMNKPRGLVTTASDEKGRPTVYTLLDLGLPWVAPVGRLDQASEGLLLFTNDSEWAAQIASPASGIPKTYRVQVSVIANSTLMTKLMAGISDGGDVLHAAQASVLRSGKRNSWVEIVLHEGRNRQIRRMFSALGIEVLRLVRVGIGPLQLGDLKKGQVRALTADEKAAIDQALADAAVRRSPRSKARILSSSRA